MKSRLPLLIAFAAAALAARAGTPVASSITAATVYLDRAVVTRTAALDLAAGERQVAFEGLPASLVDASLQVAGRGSARVTILDVTAVPAFLEAPSNERYRAVQEELTALQWQARTLADRAALLDQQQGLLASIAKFATTPQPAARDAAAPPRPGTAEWQQLLDFHGAGLEKVASERQKLDRQKEELGEKTAAVEKQLEQLRGNQGRNVKNVVVRLSVEQAGRLELTLGYLIPGARWTPAYDARFSTTERKLALGYSAVVSQGTGEDWTGVELTLSTARPALGGAAPELRTWVVAQREERPRPAVDEMVELRRESRMAKGAMAPAPAMALQEMAAEDREAVAATAVVEKQATSATFRIAARTDVPSDNAPHKVGIATVPLAAELAYQTAPKLLPAAFLNASVKNDSDYPVLAGPMAVFLDGTFVANARLKTVMPGEKFDLSLGVDDGIHVERKLLNRFTEDMGLVTKTIRVTYDVKITLTNNKRTPEKIAVKDQIPLSRHEKIEVRQLEPDPKLVKPDEQGLLTWTLDLKPGEKRELPLKISITHPRDFPVAGLE